MKRLAYFGLAVVLIIIALIGRAAAHSHAIAAAKAIVAADQTGTSITAPAAALKDYVAHHTGASVQYSLVGSYDRDMAAARAQAAAANGSGAVYAAAQASCAGHADSIQQARCVQAYVAAHASSESQAAPVATPNPQAYIYVLKAPHLTADLPTTAAALAVIVAGAGFIRRKRG